MPDSIALFFYTLVSFPFVNRNSERATLLCLADASPFATGCNCPIAAHAHTHFHVADDTRRIIFLPSLPDIGLSPVKQKFPVQYTNAGMHCATIHTFCLTIIRFLLVLLTTAYEWLATVCCNDGLLLATICRLLSVRLFRIAIIEATHFSDANLA